MPAETEREPTNAMLRCNKSIAKKIRAISWATGKTMTAIVDELLGQAVDADYAAIAPALMAAGDKPFRRRKSRKAPSA